MKWLKYILIFIITLISFITIYYLINNKTEISNLTEKNKRFALNTVDIIKAENLKKIIKEKALLEKSSNWITNEITTSSVKYNSEIISDRDKKIYIETTTDINNIYDNLNYSKFVINAGIKAWILGIKSKTDNIEFSKSELTQIGEIGYSVNFKGENGIMGFLWIFKKKNIFITIQCLNSSDEIINTENIEYILNEKFPLR
ncbi:hypothetical protein [Wenyingzhuangia sp. IMCC45467]